LLLFNIRFLIAGVLMLFYAHAIQKNRFPQGSTWASLLLFGLLNTTLALGLYILALRGVSAGIGSLMPAINPLIITVLSGIWMGTKVRAVQWLSMGLGMAGILVASYPLLLNSTATVWGLSLMGLSMLSYSVGVIYYARRAWKVPSLVVNGWQVLLGGLMLTPFTFLLHQKGAVNHYDFRFFWSELWLIIPVSIVSVQLWLYLLKVNTVKASMWLFLCPVFGFVYAAILVKEPITLYTIAGTGLVIAGLYMGQRARSQ
jgi:probable blue pigment (indigoidine) exporter